MQAVTFQSSSSLVPVLRPRLRKNFFEPEDEHEKNHQISALIQNPAHRLGQIMDRQRLHEQTFNSQSVYFFI